MEVRKTAGATDEGDWKPCRLSGQTGLGEALEGLGVSNSACNKIYYIYIWLIYGRSLKNPRNFYIN
jgi:hypothetical protein